MTGPALLLGADGQLGAELAVRLPLNAYGVSKLAGERLALSANPETLAGGCSWIGFARRIFALPGLSRDLRAVSSEAFGAAARRPANPVLVNARTQALGLRPLRP